MASREDDPARRRTPRSGQRATGAGSTSRRSGGTAQPRSASSRAGAQRRPAGSAERSPASSRSSASSRSTSSRGQATRSQASRTQTSRSRSAAAGRDRVRSTAGHPRKVYRAQTRVPLASGRRRLSVVLLVMVLIISFYVLRAFQLQAYDAQANAAAAASKMSATRTLIAQRGSIVDRNGVVLASSQQAVRVVASPLMISRNGIAVGQDMSKRQKERAAQAPGMVADIVAKHLELDRAQVLRQITDMSKPHYVVLARQVPAYTYLQLQNELGKAFKGVGLSGISKEDDPVRIYPAGDVAPNVVGFMNSDGQGAGGLEYSLNDQLTGKNGVESYDSSANGRIPLGKSTLVPAVNGSNYTLTLDSDFQMTVNQLLSSAVASAGAKTGTVVVQNVKNGELLALTTTPGFSSNEVGKADNANLGNRAISEPYEPGSVQKVLTFAALADKGLVTPSTRLSVPNRMQSGDGKLKDAFEHGTENWTAEGVLANSSNIGTAMLTRQMDKATLVNYLKKFGLGQRTGLGLPGESGGQLPKATMPDYSRDQVSFGQGLSVTAVQEASAIAAVANGGVYNPPTVIKSGVDGQDKAIKVPTKDPHRVVSEKAAKQTLQMMEAVITSKAKDRALTNYRWAGKTGTAQRINPDTGKYSGYTASFVGVAPAENPQLLVYVVIDQPTKGSEGSTLALPVAKQIMQLALPRYGIAPSTTQAPKPELEYQP